MSSTANDLMGGASGQGEFLVGELAFLSVVVACSSGFTLPVGIAVQLLHYSTWFQAALLSPVLLGGLSWIIRVIFTEDALTTGVPGPTWILVYTFGAVLLTGGIEVSPLTPLVVIVPLLTRAGTSPKERQRLIMVAAAALIAIYLLSFHSWFHVANSFPADGGWTHAGRNSREIAGMIMLFGLAVEAVKLRRLQTHQSPVSVVR